MFRTPLSNDIITIALLLSLTLIAIVSYVNGKRLITYFGILVNSHYINRFSKDIKLFDGFNILIYLVFNIAIAAILFQFVSLEDQQIKNFKIYGLAFLLVFSFFATKLALELLLSKLLDVNSFFRLYLFRKISYRHFFGILCLPIIAFLAYHDFFLKNLGVWMLCGLGVLYLISYLILMKPFFEKIKQNMFYFILYLCALEISPYVILYKLII